jgi:hypothetical protein
MKKIVLITTTQPSANPRLVKEANTFSESGYEVIVLYCFVADWAQVLDKELLKNVKWTFKQIGGEDKNSLTYKLSRYAFAVYKFINKNLGASFFSGQAHARCYKALLKAAIKLNADYYIGHNPGAMAIAANAAKSTNAKAGFDFEDYHRGEYLDKNTIEVKRQIFLEKKYINRFTYLSAASPLIKEKIESDYPSLDVSFVTLLNSFSIKEQPALAHSNVEDNSLNLFWFSQHIGKNRGLQIIFEALKEMSDSNIQLTLAGNYTNDIKKYFLNYMQGLENNVHFIGVISPNELASVSSKYDVGLALEPAFSINNDIALSNKIFTYLLAGNALILSETSMQKQFNEEYHVGLSFPIDDKNALIDCINFYKNKNNLVKQRESNFSLASSYMNWEKESKKLLAVIE